MIAGIKDVASTVREARGRKCLTQQELGQRVGLPQSHISKIEKGDVDVKLSSLTEIARALDLEVKLVPREALRAVEGAVRVHAPTVETRRAVASLDEQARLAQRIKARFPDLPEAEAFQNAIRSIRSLPLDHAHWQALNEALKSTAQVKKFLDSQGGTAALAKSLNAATTTLRHFRNIQAQAPNAQGPGQLPAYRLEDDDD